MLSCSTLTNPSDEKQFFCLEGGVGDVWVVSLLTLIQLMSGQLASLLSLKSFDL